MKKYNLLFVLMIVLPCIVYAQHQRHRPPANNRKTPVVAPTPVNRQPITQRPTPITRPRDSSSGSSFIDPTTGFPRGSKFVMGPAPAGGGLTIGEKPKVSLRQETAINRSLVKDRKPLAYEDLREDDAVFSAIVWRRIDCREKMNKAFLYNGVEDNGDQRFFSIIAQAVFNPDSTQRVKAFDPDDDRFTTEIPYNTLIRKVGVKMDTVRRESLVEGGKDTYVITQTPLINVDSVYKFDIKEQYIFDKESSRLFVRIIGIKPIARQRPTKNAQYEDVSLFWIYYPDLRPTLSKYEAFNEKNYSGRMTWEEVFESRYFSSYITRTTLNNVQNQTFKQMYPNNEYLRLIEGEKTKDKIFNYEQDLWSY